MCDIGAGGEKAEEIEMNIQIIKKYVGECQILA